MILFFELKNAVVVVTRKKIKTLFQMRIDKKITFCNSYNGAHDKDYTEK